MYVAVQCYPWVGNFLNITVLADVKIVWNRVTASNVHSFVIRGMESRLLQETNLSWTV